jgi:hypothetical protein
MERAEAQSNGRPVNQRDKALVDALRAGIAALEKTGDAPRATVTGRDPAELSLGADFIRYYEALVWANNVGGTGEAGFSQVSDEVKARCITTALRDFIEQGKISIMLPMRGGKATGVENLSKFASGGTVPQGDMPRVGEDGCTVYRNHVEMRGVPDAETAQRAADDVYRNHVYRPLNTPMTDEEILAVRRAYNDGKQIEMRSIHEHVWFDANDSTRSYGFNFRVYQYRVKPVACEHAWRNVPETGNLVDHCVKCGEERA